MASQTLLCFIARCKLAEPALHLLFAQLTRRGRLSSPEPPKVERTLALLAAYASVCHVIPKHVHCHHQIAKL